MLHVVVVGLGPHCPVVVLQINCCVGELPGKVPLAQVSVCVVPPVDDIFSPAVFATVVAGQA